MRRVSLAATLVFIAVAVTYFSCDKGGPKKEDSATTAKTDDTATEGGSDTETNTNSAAQVGTVALETVQNIVQLTDPVTAYPVTDTSTDAVNSRMFDSLLIQTELLGDSEGIFLGQKHGEITTAFGTAGSKAYCESVNSAMKFFKEVSSGDFDLCALKMAATKGQAVKANTPQTWDFKIAMGEGTHTFRMKFTIEPTSDGGIKSFENFTCEGGGKQPLSQSGYIKQTVDAGKIKVHRRAQGDHGAGTYKIRVDMDGRLGTDGRPLGLKTLDYAEAGENRTVHSKIKQSATNLESIGYETSGGYELQYVRFVELLDDNDETGTYMITKVGYGDGAALLRSISESATETSTVGWNGQTLAANNDEPRKAKVADRTKDLLAAKGDDRNLEFASTEIYDCKGDADFTYEGKYEDFSDCIGAYEIDQEGSTMCNAVAN